MSAVGLNTPGDLGLYLAQSLVATYEASHRMMPRWIASWEVDSSKSLSDTKKAEKLKEAASEIRNLLSMVGRFADGSPPWGTLD